jgi:hypothetical protein
MWGDGASVVTDHIAHMLSAAEDFAGLFQAGGGIAFA